MRSAEKGSRPIIVVSFDRPALLEKTLRSLLTQIQSVDPANVHLFQDGYRSRFGNPNRAEASNIFKSINIFKQLFPKGTVHFSEPNLGIALNFERAERFAFDELDSEAAYFFEDDMVLSEYYTQVLEVLTDFALQDHRVGYVAAYGNHAASLEEQYQRAREVIPMGHKWGFALTRRQWRNQKEIVDQYLNFVRNCEYSDRPHDQIKQYFKSLGVQMDATSQDAAKDVAGVLTRSIKLMCFAVHGYYIGEQGTHFSKKIYQQHGYNRTQLIDRPTLSFDFPDSSSIEKMLLQNERLYQYSGPIKSAPSGEEPQSSHYLSNELLEKVPIHMKRAEKLLFRDTLSGKTGGYLEFGSGGSTCIAAAANFDRVVSVENSQHWIGTVRDLCAKPPFPLKSHVELVHGDIGPVKEWGVPADTSSVSKWPNYIKAGWEAYADPCDGPNVVFIDGRFRVACAMSVLISTPHPEDITVILHDYDEARPHYKVIMEFYELKARADTLVVLKPKPDLSRSKAFLCFIDYQFDYR